MIKGYEYQSDFARRYVAEGREKGFAEGHAVGRLEGRVEARTEAMVQAVLTVLRLRGLTVPDIVRERMLLQRDLRKLESWLEKALVASSVEAVVDEIRTEDLMVKGDKYPDDSAKEYATKGCIEGAARAVLIVLQARGFAVPDLVRERILAQKDLQRLKWGLEKAAVASSVVEVLLDVEREVH
jgi:hypothetical protein